MGPTIINKGPSLTLPSFLIQIKYNNQEKTSLAVSYNVLDCHFQQYFSYPKKLS